MLSYLAMCFKLLQCLTLEHQQVELQHRFLQTYLLNLVPDTHVLNKVALSCRILNVFILTISRDSKAPTLMIVGRRELSGSIFSNCSSICCGTCICTNHMFFIFFAWWLGNGESFGTLKSTRKFIKELVPEVISGMTSQGHCSIICPSTKVARDTPVEVSPGQAGEKLATCLSIVPRNTNAGAGARAHRFNLNSNTSYPSYGSGRNIEISEPVHYRFWRIHTNGCPLGSHDSNDFSVECKIVPTVLQGSFSILSPHNFPHLTAMFPVVSRPCRVGAASPSGEGE